MLAVAEKNSIADVMQGEIFKETKERLSKRTGIKGKQFEKIKFASVPRASYSNARYLEDGEFQYFSGFLSVDANSFTQAIFCQMSLETPTIPSVLTMQTRAGASGTKVKASSFDREVISGVCAKGLSGLATEGREMLDLGATANLYMTMFIYFSLCL